MVNDKYIIVVLYLMAFYFVILSKVSGISDNTV